MVLGIGQLIVHLEMVNIFLAMRLFANIWSSKKVLINCDNQAVVTILMTGKTHDAFLAACARNILVYHILLWSRASTVAITGCL